MSETEGDPADERRFLIRYPSNAEARIIRDSDAMRVGFSVRLLNVSTGGIGLSSPIELPLNEVVHIELENAVQRFKKAVRGFVRHCTQQSRGEYLIGIELMQRLTPLDVSILRMGFHHKDSDERPKWL